MTMQSHALSRAELIRVLTSYTGITTNDGAAAANTLIDTNLIGRNDFVTGKTILLGSGLAQDEEMGAAAFDTLTGVITLAGGVSSQILAGTIFRVLNFAGSGLIWDLAKALIIREGVTTGAGNAGGTSIIDAGLVGIGANSFENCTLVLYTGEPDDAAIGAVQTFDNVSEVTFTPAYKGGQVPAGVDYMVLTTPFRLPPGLAVVPSGPATVEPDTVARYAMTVIGVNGVVPLADLTAGTIHLYQIRAGVLIATLGPFVPTVADGYIYYDYDFTSATWEPGDEAIAVLGYLLAIGVGSVAQTATINNVAYDLSVVTISTRVSREEILPDIFNLVNAMLVSTETGGTITTDGAVQDVYINAAPAGVYEPLAVKLDLTGMGAGETVVVRTLYQVRPAGIPILEDLVTFVGIQALPLKHIALEPNRYGVQVTLQCTAGGPIDVDWEVLYRV